MQSKSSRCSSVLRGMFFATFHPHRLIVPSTPDVILMASSVTAQYAAGIAAGQIESDDAQRAVVDMLARLEARIVEYRLARKSSSLGWLFGSREATQPRDQGPLHLRRCRARQDDADGFVLRGEPGRAQAPRAFPRIHARRARTHLRVPPANESRRTCRTRIRSSLSRSNLRRRRGCSASTNSTSPTLPTR